MKIGLANPQSVSTQALAMENEAIANDEAIAGDETAEVDSTNDSGIMLLATTYNTLKGTYGQAYEDSAFFANNVIQRQYVEKVVFTNSMDPLSERGLIRNYNALNNSGFGFSNPNLTWSDLSKNNNGTISSGIWVSDDAETRKNARLRLNGVNEYVNIGKVDILNAVTLDVTISANSIQSGEKDIVSNFESGGVGLSLKSGVPTFTIYIAGTGYVSVSAKKGFNCRRKNQNYSNI